MSTMTLQELTKDCFDDLQEKVQEDFKEYIDENYLKDLFFNTDDFIEEYQDRFDDLKSEYSSEIADNNTPIYYRDLYSVFSDNPVKIDGGYNDFINEMGQENGGESNTFFISECIQKGIYYTLEREVYNTDKYDILTDDYINELKEEYKNTIIDELLEEAQENYEEITKEDIEIFINEYNDIDDLDNYVLNIKLNKNLEEKNTTKKIVKI